MLQSLPACLPALRYEYSKPCSDEEFGVLVGWLAGRPAGQSQAIDPSSLIHYHEIDQQAMAALSNIAEMVEGRTHQKMLEEGVLAPTLALAKSSLVHIRREVARCIALFACNLDSHDALMASFRLLLCNFQAHPLLYCLPACLFVCSAFCARC